MQRLSAGGRERDVVHHRAERVRPDSRMYRPDGLPEHESGVRRMMADAAGGQDDSFRSLAEAKADPDGFIVLEGDHGGQSYLVAPARRVRCSEEALANLLMDIDAAPDIWIHAGLVAKEAGILRVLDGACSRLDEESG